MTDGANRIEEIESQLQKLNNERSLLLKELTGLKKNSNSGKIALIGRKLNFSSYKGSSRCYIERV